MRTIVVTTGPFVRTLVVTTVRSGRVAAVIIRRGPTGPAGTIEVGTVTTGAPGSPATVNNSGTDTAAILDFSIPAGVDGDPGAAATVGVGTVTTGAPGSSVAITNSGTSSAAVLNFTIPRGDPGTNGTHGTNGTNGAAATIAVGTVTTGAPGSSATVTNVGSSSAAVFDFSIPAGADGSDISAEQWAFYHFMNGSASTLGWSTSAASGSIGADSTTARNGVVLLATSTNTSAGRGAAFGTTNGIASVVFGTVAAHFSTELAPTGTSLSGTDTGFYRVGFHDAYLSTEPTDGVYFRVTNGGNWYAVTRSNTSETATDTGIAPTLDTWRVFKILVNAAGTSATFYIDGALVATHANNIPTGAGRGTGEAISVCRVATTAANIRMQIDWVYRKYTPPTPLGI